jgi:kynurenine 3-monooxygenase
MREANHPALLEAVLRETIPMHGRMIHHQKSGKPTQESQTYDIHGRVSAFPREARVMN